MIYINKKNGKRYTEGQVLTWVHDGVLTSCVPSAEQLEQAGYEPYTPPAAPEPTEEDIKRQRMAEIEMELQGMDYLTSKEADGEDMTAYDEKYGGDWHQYRRLLRIEYNKLENNE
jgi:hypothetical protein